MDQPLRLRTDELVVIGPDEQEKQSGKQVKLSLAANESKCVDSHRLLGEANKLDVSDQLRQRTGSSSKRKITKGHHPGKSQDITAFGSVVLPEDQSLGGAPQARDGEQSAPVAGSAVGGRRFMEATPPRVREHIPLTRNGLSTGNSEEGPKGHGLQSAIRRVTECVGSGLATSGRPRPPDRSLNHQPKVASLCGGSSTSSDTSSGGTRREQARHAGKNQSVKPPGRFTGTCNNCGQVGHKRDVCPEARREPTPPPSCEPGDVGRAVSGEAVTELIGPPLGKKALGPYRGGKEMVSPHGQAFAHDWGSDVPPEPSDATPDSPGSWRIGTLDCPQRISLFVRPCDLPYEWDLAWRRALPPTRKVMWWNLVGLFRRFLMRIVDFLFTSAVGRRHVEYCHVVAELGDFVPEPQFDARPFTHRCAGISAAQAARVYHITIRRVLGDHELLLPETMVNGGPVISAFTGKVSSTLLSMVYDYTGDVGEGALRSHLAKLQNSVVVNSAPANLCLLGTRLFSALIILERLSKGLSQNPVSLRGVINGSVPPSPPLVKQ